jgi:hypothetical protein
MKFRSVMLAALALLCFPTAQAKQATSREPSRGRLLRELRKCLYPARPPYQCDEMSVDGVARLYERGDRSVLTKLMDVARNADGALAEALGDFFSGLLCDKTETFLNAVARRPRSEQDTLLFLASSGDGGGMGCRRMGILRRRLKLISQRRNGRLAGVARRCLAQVDDNNADNQRGASSKLRVH